MTSGQMNLFGNLMIQLDHALDNTLDKCFPKFLMDNTNRKFKGIFNIFLTVLYTVVFLFIVTTYTLDTYNAFGKVVMKPLWMNLIVVLCGVVLFFLIYTDMRYYMKKFLYGQCSRQDLNLRRN